MANGEHVQVLLAAIASKDLSAWNQWRNANPDLVPDLSGVELRNAVLPGIDVTAADMRRAELSGAVLASARLGGTKLSEANLSGADLSGADLKCAHLMRANLTGANLTGADLRYADLRGTNLADTRLAGAMVDPLQLRRALNPPSPTHRKSSRWKSRFQREICVVADPAQRPRSWIAAAASRVLKLGPALVKHEALTTLGLSGPQESPRDQKEASPGKQGSPADTSGT